MFSWGYDAFERDAFAKEVIEEVLGDREKFPSIEEIGFMECFENPKTRNQIRKEFREER